MFVTEGKLWFLKQCRQRKKLDAHWDSECLICSRAFVTTELFVQYKLHFNPAVFEQKAFPRLMTAN